MISNYIMIIIQAGTTIKENSIIRRTFNMKKKKIFISKMSNAVEPAAPMLVWGKGCAGKGGSTHNAPIINNKSEAKGV